MANALSEEIEFIKQLQVANDQTIRNFTLSAPPGEEHMFDGEKGHHAHAKVMLESIEKALIELAAFKAAQHHSKVLKAASHL